MGECRDIVARMPQCPPIHNETGGPFYNPLEDYINMPLWSDFENGEEFYITMFHEMIHSTGHESRLSRKESEGKNPTAIEAYSIEELIAELGACYLMSYAGIQQRNLSNSAAYIQGWLSKLKDDKRMIVYASAHAQRAVEFILNSAPEPVVKEEREELV
jgi:antirestriction protein ArdC